MLTSRLFSLPPPLPRPDVSRGSIWDSETATTTYPTHAAIETTQASLARGDWGLKRPLPLRSTTRTSTPIVNIDNIDSIDHITDFSSAADHALTLRKWQELNLPLTKMEPQRAASGPPPAKSVFDSQYVNTVAMDSPPKVAPKERWKFNGPWLAGKTDGEFNDYVERKVKRRKLDFRRYLRDDLAQSKIAVQRREAVEKGEGVDNQIPSDVSISDEEVDTYIRHLRNNEHKLHRHIAQYLDLPRDESVSSDSTNSQYDEYDERGPSTTHPSAGLSYLHTASHIYNHPDLGPQAHKAPVRGRVIEPQTVGKQARMNEQALIGVAGVVGKDNQKTAWNKDTFPGVTRFDPDVPGGSKIWANPDRASIDSDGSIVLQVRRAEPDTIDIAQGNYVEEEPQLPPAAVAGAEMQDLLQLTPDRPRRQEGSLRYGLENERGPKSSGRATPFLGPDDEAPDMNDFLLLHNLSGRRR